MAQNLCFYVMIWHTLMYYHNYTKFVFLFYDMAYPNDYYNGTKFVLLWYDITCPNDYYNNTLVLFTCFKPSGLTALCI